MVLTRNQKRKLQDLEIDEIDKVVDCKSPERLITKRQRTSESESSGSETETLDSETFKPEQAEYEEYEEPEVTEDVKMDLEKLQGIFKTSIQKIFKKMKDSDFDQEKDAYSNFNDLVYSVYEGDFFEREPIDERKKYLKEHFTEDKITEMTNELETIKANYKNNSPNIVDILKMNVNMEQKKKLLEKLYWFRNSEILTPEYNSTLKFLNTNMLNSDDPELLELEEKILKNSLNKSESYRMKILKSKMSFENKVVAYKKLEIMETYEGSDTSEYAKYKSWMDTLLSVPFGDYNDSGITIDSDINDIKQYIKNVRSTLDQKLSFLEKPKDQIINIVTQMVRNPDVNINAIGLCGSAGTGKTEICQSIAKALNRPFASISLGGESDASSLTGHGFTYVGSNPGRLIDILTNSKSMNPIVLIDELDKVSETFHGKEIIGTLIHLTDSTTNNKYNHDKYFSGIEFDLSKVLFVFTYNDPTKIDNILADRLLKITVDNYNHKEKLEITNKHIITYLLDKFKFKKDDISFTQEALEYIIREADQNGGMRNIKTKIKIILSRINNLLLTNEEDNIIKLKYKQLYKDYKSLPVVIPYKHIDILLDESITDNSKTNLPPSHMYM